MLLMRLPTWLLKTDRESYSRLPIIGDLTIVYSTRLALKEKCLILTTLNCRWYCMRMKMGGY
jgi:hypothetical protein